MLFPMIFAPSECALKAFVNLIWTGNQNIEIYMFDIFIHITVGRNFIYIPNA